MLKLIVTSSFYLVLTTAAAASLPAFTLQDTVKTIWLYNRIPALAANTPNVFGSGYLGYVSAGLAIQNRTRVELEGKWRPDGNAATYIGLGNPHKWIGVGLVANIYGLSNKGGEKGNFGEGSIDLHFSRSISDFIFVGIGGFNIIQHNTHSINQVRSYYFATTSLIPIRQDNKRAFGFAYLNLGIGNGTFLPRSRALEKELTAVNFFGGVALQVLPEANLILEWTGVDFTIAAGIYPIRKFPLHILFGIADLNLDKQRLILSLGYSLQLFQNKRKYQNFSGNVPTAR